MKPMHKTTWLFDTEPKKTSPVLYTGPICMRKSVTFLRKKINVCLTIAMGYLAYPGASGSCIASPFILALSIKVAFNFSNSMHLETQSLIKIYLICYSVIQLIPSKIVNFLFLYSL